MADRSILTQEYLRQRIDYNPETGELTWRARAMEDFPSVRIGRAWNSRNAGKPAFNQKHTCGYRVSRFQGINCYAHRIIWQMVYGEQPDTIDHLNGDRSDNRLANLRNCTVALNSRNQRRNIRNASGVTGVHRAHGKWNVKVGPDRFGLIEKFEDAVALRRKIARERGYTERHGIA